MKKILFIVAIFAALVVSLTRVSAEEKGEGLVTTSSEPISLDSASSIIAAKFMKQLNILNKVTLEDSFFESEAFKSLKDWSQPIPAETPGRANPFAPL